MEYKDYKGSIEFDEEYQEYYGKVLDIKTLALYGEAKTIEELEQYFHETIDDLILFKED